MERQCKGCPPTMLAHEHAAIDNMSHALDKWFHCLGHLMVCAVHCNDANESCYRNDVTPLHSVPIREHAVDDANDKRVNIA
jgi:Tfp pilus assembly ATPase PilU